MKKIILLLFISLLSSVVNAAPEAEYGKLAHTYTLFPDGSQEYRYFMELTLFTHTAMNRTYGESFIVYNPLWQELVINESYTRQKDGTIITTPPNAFVEVLPRAAANAPVYNNLVEMVVVHTGLELGATIYLDYTLRSKAGYYDELDIFETLQQSSPIKSLELKITVPETKELHADLKGVAAKESIHKAEGMVNYRWEIVNLKASSRAQDVDVMNGGVPFLAATTFGSETEALNVLQRQFNPAGDLQLLTFAEALTENSNSDWEKLNAIMDYVINQLDNSRLTLRDTGFRLRPPYEVTASAYGTEIEKINMLVSLLNAAEIQSETYAAYRVDAQEGSLGLSAIRELLVMTRINGKKIYLTPFNFNPSPVLTYSQRIPVRSLTVPGERVYLPELSSEVRLKADMTLEADGKIKLESVTTLGDLHVSYKTGGDAHEVKSSSTLQAEIVSDRMIITLPDASNSFNRYGYGNFNSVRKENLSLPYVVNEELEYRITLPEGVKLQTPEQEKVTENKAGKMIVRIRQVNKNQVEVTRSLITKETFITPDKYKDFRTLATAWSDPNNRKLILKK